MSFFFLPVRGVETDGFSLIRRWLTPAGLDVAEKLLSLDPALRPTADEALLMEYFKTEEPKPELPDM